MVLAVLDHLKEGGSLRKLFSKEDTLGENTDVIENEDIDVENERNLVKNYIDR